MPSYDTSYRNAASLALSKLYEGGTVELRSASNAVLATLEVPADAFANNGTGRAGLGSELTAAVSASGTATNYRAIHAGGGVETGTVGTSGADMIIDNAELVAGGVAKITVWNNSYPTSS